MTSEVALTKARSRVSLSLTLRSASTRSVVSLTMAMTPAGLPVSSSTGEYSRSIQTGSGLP